ncbi:MAG: hypothetical protein DMF88_26205 [Acidobacteria bacterium]|nr:MAG: hypothetical protein DMF88_26205 [Acidobacteriota bacterium]
MTMHDVRRCLTALAVVCLSLPLLAQNQVRILQSNAAGDRVHIIDPATNTVVGEITDIEAAHGVVASPDGTRVYVSSEIEFLSRGVRTTSPSPLTGGKCMWGSGRRSATTLASRM